MASVPQSPNDPTYEVELRQDVRIPTADPAVTLGADLYLPAGAGPVPLLVMALPYRKDLGGADLLFRYFVRRGYACMIVDLLGTGSSDGEPRVAFAADDAQDAVDAITWGAEQDWCDGAVGMWGHSYGGMMTMRTAARRPAPLKAIIPVQGFIDPEVDFVHPDHGRGCYGPGTWGSGMLGNLLLPPMHAPDDDEALTRWRKRLDSAEPHVLDLFRTQPGDPQWRGRAFDTADIEVPALCFLGWRDLFADAQARAFESMRGPKRLVAGPWMHVLPVVADEGPLDFFGMCLAWFDRWLKGVDNGADVEPSAYYVQGPAPFWTTIDGWPVRGRTTASVGNEAGEIPLALTSTADRSDPTVGALSGLTRLPFAGIGMPFDQHEDDLKSTCWTSEPLAEALTILGRPEVTLDAPASGRVVVKLTHVDPAGRSVLITSGANGEGSPRVEPRDLVLDATAYQVPAGHRIRVVVSDADFPRLWPVPTERPPEVTPVTMTFPTLSASELRDVELPEQPAYLAALAATLQAGEGPAWSLERELVSGALTMSMETRAATSLPDRGVEMESSTSVVVTASLAAQVRVTGTSDWLIRWPDHPDITVHSDTVMTDDAIVVEGRVAFGDDVVFERTWSSNLQGRAVS